eukprot:scaffold158178_cov17-Tisochrysis_lutea.AAC.1
MQSSSYSAALHLEPKIPVTLTHCQGGPKGTSEQSSTNPSSPAFPDSEPVHLFGPMPLHLTEPLPAPPYAHPRPQYSERDQQLLSTSPSMESAAKRRPAHFKRVLLFRGLRLK